MYHDPTFAAACALEMDDIREKKGCAACKHRDKRYWQTWTCKHNNRLIKGKKFCKYWKYKRGYE